MNVHPSSITAKLPADSKDIIDRVLSDKYVQGIWKIASKVLSRNDNPDLFPHYTPPGLPYYVYFDSSFWTSGFFPGSVWALYERSLRTPLTVPSSDLLSAARKWQAELAKEQFKTDNHDLGFMIMPSFSRDHELTGSAESLDVVVQAARSLATRFNPVAGTIRSWSGARNKEYNLHEANDDFVVVIDSMMNLELLYYATHHAPPASGGDGADLAAVATVHAATTLRNHVRGDASSFHLVNYDARRGVVRHRLTNQGYAHESTWARGQAWALYGFASVYRWTGEARFLDAAARMAEYFVAHTIDDETGAAAPWWDLQAPRPGSWDVSGACCACSGMLLLAQLAPERCGHLVGKVLRMLDTVMREAEAPAGADVLFVRSTINDNEDAMCRMAEHGLVYADYYFIEAGNRLLELFGEDRRELLKENAQLSLA